MHADKEVDIRNIFGVHVEPAKLAICLPEKLNQLHVVELPGPIDRVRLEALVMNLLNEAACLEALHEG